jgi:hypothetical protein
MILKSMGKFVMEALVEAGVFWVLWKITGQNPAQPSAQDIRTPKGAAQAALHILVVGKKSGKGDEAIFSGLKAQLEPRLQDNLDELMSWPKMKPRVPEFRYTVAFAAEKLSEAKAVGILRSIADLPTVQERYDRAENDGLLAPEDPSVAKARIEAFLAILGTKLIQAAGGIKHLGDKINADVQTTGMQATLDGWVAKMKTKTGF